MPNGIDLILEDHRYVEQLFADVHDSREAGAIGQILDALTAHDDAEHAALYPLAGEVLGDAELLMSMDAAHSAIKKNMEHLRAQEGPVLLEELKRLQALVDQHVADEESELLPALGRQATPAQLEWLGARILDTKQRVG